MAGNAVVIVNAASFFYFLENEPDRDLRPHNISIG